MSLLIRQHRTSVPLLLAALMCLAAVIGFVGQPGQRQAAAAPPYLLDQVVPRRAGPWTEVQQGAAQVVNPQTQQLLDKLYSQTLSRVYANADGYRIMLSMAYGDDQRGGLQAHMPEVCYPAQGFKVHDQADRQLATPFGEIPVRRISTSLGVRHEPVTYWFNFGNRSMRGSSPLERRLVQLKFAMTGTVPDGLLVRVSSIDTDTERAYAVQEQFVRDLLGALKPEDRLTLTGRGSAGP